MAPVRISAAEGDTAAYHVRGLAISDGGKMHLDAGQEENFADGMKQNAMEMDAFDYDRDNMLDFGEFSALFRAREEGTHTEEELRARFLLLDADGSGKVDANEYVKFSLTDALYAQSLPIRIQLPLAFSTGVQIAVSPPLLRLELRV